LLRFSCGIGLETTRGEETCPFVGIVLEKETKKQGGQKGSHLEVDLFCYDFPLVLSWEKERRGEESRSVHLAFLSLRWREEDRRIAG
jgi:hypothetical protein